MGEAGSMRRWRQILTWVLALYTLALAAFGVATGESGGESGVEGLFLVPVVTAAVMLEDTMQPEGVGVWVKED